MLNPVSARTGQEVASKMRPESLPARQAGLSAGYSLLHGVCLFFVFFFSLPVEANYHGGTVLKNISGNLGLSQAQWNTWILFIVMLQDSRCSISLSHKFRSHTENEVLDTFVMTFWPQFGHLVLVKCVFPVLRTIVPQEHRALVLCDGKMS